MSTIEAVYPYVNENGVPLYEQVRFGGKKFAFRTVLKNGRCEWGLQNAPRRVLYNLQEITQAENVFVVEGEKDADRLNSLGLTSTTNPGGAGKWRDEFSVSLKGKHIFIVPDADKPGRLHAKSVADSVVNHAARAFVLPPFKHAKDVSEWLDNGGTKKRLLKLSKKAKPYQPRTTNGSIPCQNEPLISGPKLVKQLELFFSKRVILPPGAELVLALWIISTYVHQEFDCLAHLCIASPVKRCGKTVLAELVSLVAARAKFTVNITEAALFRTIQEFQPTIIIDESEMLSNQRSERSQCLLSLTNGSHRRTATVIRCVGPHHIPTEFAIFCPKVFILIGSLPDTMNDRSIVASCSESGKTKRLIDIDTAKCRRRLSDAFRGLLNGLKITVAKSVRHMRKKIRTICRTAKRTTGHLLSLSPELLFPTA
jgi:hypothetical protein